MAQGFTFTFWGTRGSYPVPGAATLKYGGNTPCVEVRCNDRLIILDAGTGLIGLGGSRLPQHMDILLSHTHIDHVMGFPFFQPAYNAGRSVRLWAGHLLPDFTLRQTIGKIMSPPIFPLKPEDLKAQIGYNDFFAGEALRHEDFDKAGIAINTHPLNHPDRATAYRITLGKKSLCYVTDVEHDTAAIDEKLIGFLKDADWLIYDCTYDDREFDNHLGWGHSTWQQAVRLCKAAGVKNLAVFHHDPMANDGVLDKRAEELLLQFPAGIIAREGLTVTL